MKIVDERETQKNKQTNKQRLKRARGNRSYSERVRAKWFCCTFKLGFLQLIWNASLIFESNLELALTVILKQRELYESKHVAVEGRCLKIWDLLSFFICSFKSFKCSFFEKKTLKKNFENSINMRRGKGKNTSWVTGKNKTLMRQGDFCLIL